MYSFTSAHKLLYPVDDKLKDIGEVYHNFSPKRKGGMISMLKLLVLATESVPPHLISMKH